MKGTIDLLQGSSNEDQELGAWEKFKNAKTQFDIDETTVTRIETLAENDPSGKYKKAREDESKYFNKEQEAQKVIIRLDKKPEAEEAKTIEKAVRVGAYDNLQSISDSAVRSGSKCFCARYYSVPQ